MPIANEKPAGFEFRPANANEMAEVTNLGNYVFAQPPDDNKPPSLLQPEWTQCAFDGQKLAAISGAYPFIVRMNGKTAQMHGVTLVGTEPAYRRRGLVRQLITDLLHKGKEAGDVASILLASRGAIYQRFGYGIASTMVRYDFDPREVTQFQFPEPTTGRLERMTKDDAYPHITQVQKAYSRPRNMRALRVDSTWTGLLSDLEKHKAYCLVHFDNQNQADGYCLYSTKWDQEDSQELTITDFAYTSMTAYRALWENLTSHDLVNRIKWNNVPEDDPAPGILLEPRNLHRKTIDGIWMRIIDISSALCARRYDHDGEVILRISEDSICPWNTGNWLLRVVDGDASVVKTSSAPDIMCNPNALASMIAGQSSISYLDQINRISVSDKTRSSEFDQLFATRFKPSLSFGF